MMPKLPPTPKWFTAIVVVAALPVFLMPWLLNAPCASDEGVRVWVWFYPIYVVVAGWLAWQCYPQRPALAWVLTVLMVMCHAAIWMLAIDGLHNMA